MKVEYKKDLRHNYMVIRGNEKIEPEAYTLKMLERQTIVGILSVELRRLDNNLLLYYDITAKQSMTAIFDKSAFTMEKVKQLCEGIIDTIEQAYEYLLMEDDFILEPDNIYMDIVSNEPCLCFLPGYSRGIKEQMSSLLEYLMNKVDYNDREAVLLVYRLYAVSREEGYTFDHLKRELKNTTQLKENKCNEDNSNFNEDNSKQKEDNGKYYEDDKISNLNNKKYIIQNDKEGSNEQGIANEKIRQNIRNGENKPIGDFGKDSVKFEKKERTGTFNKTISDNGNQPSSRIPVMMEKIEREEEMSCYSLSTYLYTAGCIVGGLIIIALSLITKIIYNTYGNRVDFIKLSALLLIFFCVEGYLLKLIWDKKNKISKIVTKSEYIDPRQVFMNEDVKKTMSPISTEAIHRKSNVPMKQINHNQTNENENVLGNSTMKSIHSQENTYCIHSDSYDTSGMKSINIKPDTNNIKQAYYNKRDINESDISVVDNPTCLLNAPKPVNNMTTDMKAVCVLEALDKENYVPIPITDFPFFIGKLKKNVDYCLEKDVVSRYHAKITEEESHYYITDLNSTNGTFVNGEALQTYDKKEIKFGDEIDFANIRYRFQ